jgi:hypothetical protein
MLRKLDVVVLELDVDGRKLSLGQNKLLLILGINMKDHLLLNCPQVKSAEIVDKGATCRIWRRRCFSFHSSP